MSNSNLEANPYDKEYHTYHMNLLAAFVAQIKQQPPFHTEELTEGDAEFLSALEALTQNTTRPDWREDGQTLLCRVVSTYPHLMPLLYRDLLWFFGGDCLHYMPDDEIAVFQQLDELRENAKEEKRPFNYQDTRAQLLRMH